MRTFSFTRVNTDSKTIYLTFDDGPEPKITEFILDLLDHYGFKATFFCTGKCAERYPELLKRIQDTGHLVGNHTYSHIKAYDCNAVSYMRDVERADHVLNTQYFRPPNGCLTFLTWLRLRRYKLVYWTKGSKDWCHDVRDFEDGLRILKTTEPGDIILFHFSQELQEGTRAVLPHYLEWLKVNNFTSDSLTGL